MCLLICEKYRKIGAGKAIEILLNMERGHPARIERLREIDSNAGASVAGKMPSLHTRKNTKPFRIRCLALSLFSPWRSL